MNHCPRCRAPNPVSNRFCEQCGGVLAAPRGHGQAPHHQHQLPPPRSAANEPMRELRLGRDPSNHITIPWGNDQVSRFHARITVSGSNFLIEDLKSSNGTLVNGLRAQRPTPFTLYDEIRFGSFVWNTAELLPHLQGAGGSPQGGPMAPTFPEAGASTEHRPLGVRGPRQPPRHPSGGHVSPPPRQPSAPALVSSPTPPPVVYETPTPVRSRAAQPVPARNDWLCPNCGSDRIRKAGAGDPVKKSGGMGCVTCLLLVIIFLIAGWAILLVVGAALAAATVLIAKYWPFVLGLLILFLIAKAFSAVHQSKLYYCERCGTSFTRR